MATSKNNTRGSSAKRPTPRYKTKGSGASKGLEGAQRMRKVTLRTTSSNKKPISTVHTDGNGYEAADLALKKYMRQKFAKTTNQGLPIHAVFYDAWMGSFDVICSNQFGFIRGRGYNPETGSWSTGRYDQTWAGARDLCNGRCIWYEVSDERVRVRKR